MDGMNLQPPASGPKPYAPSPEGDQYASRASVKGNRPAGSHGPPRYHHNRSAVQCPIARSIEAGLRGCVGLQRDDEWIGSAVGHV